MNIKKPTLTYLIGIPGCGKSTYAKTLKGYTIHSSDALRKELFNDENFQGDNNAVFEELHKRIINDLRNGKDVVYDATNLNRKRRMDFLRRLSKIECHKSCKLVIAPYHTCVKRNNNRERKVPIDAMKRMYMSFQPPHKSEGWDDIDIIVSCGKYDYKDYTIHTLYNKATGIDNFNQCNKFHTLTLGEHCRKAMEYILSYYNENLLLASTALIHDVGKVFTQTNINSKGEKDGDCHYYGHNSVGAYDSIFYSINAQRSIDDILHIAVLIYFHMVPYNWKDEKEGMLAKTKGRFRTQVGEELFNEIIALYDADRYAH